MLTWSYPGSRRLRSSLQHDTTQGGGEQVAVVV